MCLASDLASPLATMFRICFAVGTLSKALEVTRIVPLPKADADPTNVGSY